MKAAVVGSTGVLGRAIVPLLLKEGYEVRALARSAEKAARVLPGGIEVVECDLLAPDVGEKIEGFLRGCDVVMHTATSIPANVNVPNVWEANTRLRTEVVRMLLDASLAVGAKQYIQQSITMAYPDCGEAWISEDTPLNDVPTRGHFSNPVVIMEGMIRETDASKLSWCILRGGSFVGPDTFQERLIVNLREGKEPVMCDGSNYTSLIHVADIGAAFVAAARYAPAGSIFNIVDEPLRQHEYYDRLAAAVGAPKPARDESSPCPPSWRCDNSRAKSTLHWQPTHDIIPS